jgi:hypothetical protein
MGGLGRVGIFRRIFSFGRGFHGGQVVEVELVTFFSAYFLGMSCGFATQQ